jgi:hypothetical protein
VPINEQAQEYGTAENGTGGSGEQQICPHRSVGEKTFKLTLKRQRQVRPVQSGKKKQRRGSERPCGTRGRLHSGQMCRTREGESLDSRARSFPGSLAVDRYLHCLNLFSSLVAFCFVFKVNVSICVCR